MLYRSLFMRMSMTYVVFMSDHVELPSLFRSVVDLTVARSTAWVGKQWYLWLQDSTCYPASAFYPPYLYLLGLNTYLLPGLRLLVEPRIAKHDLPKSDRNELLCPY
jgi:hypothetical protein